ncbi:MAG: RraA family protein, partial [Syntrophobacterales bacterium]
MSCSLRPAFDDIKLVGPAVTVRIPSIDSTLCHKVTEIVEEGDVIVIDRCGDNTYACWGGVTTLAAKIRGAAGTIVDGPITDILEIRQHKFPVYYRCISALTTKLLGIDGEINTTIQCGGVTVHPGDLIVGDANGIVIVSPDETEYILEEALRRQEREKQLIRRLKEGELLPHITGVDKLISLKKP